MPPSFTWLIFDVTTDLLNVFDVGVIRPRLASIDREDGEVITGRRKIQGAGVGEGRFRARVYGKGRQGTGVGEG